MWTLSNHTPYKAASTWGRDKDGVHEWIVCVKATFDINPDGSAELSDDQLEPLRLPEYHGEPGWSSVRFDTDLVAMKPTTDVVLNGTAYAPGGLPSADFPVAMTVGPIQKSLKVKGHRRWKAGAFGVVASSAEPVASVRVVYERAYGGYDRTTPDPKAHRLDVRNPIGCGVATEASSLVGQPLPNFEYADGTVDKKGPAGFGAIDSFWSPRRELAGTYDDEWRKSRLPLLPLDWDPRSLLCSPVDQQPANHLRGGEDVELLNLTPDGRLRFTLPKVHLTFSTRIRGRAKEHRARLTTVTIEPDHHRVVMTWLTSLTCPTDVDDLDVTVIRELPYLT